MFYLLYTSLYSSYLSSALGRWGLTFFAASASQLPRNGLKKYPVYFRKFILVHGYVVLPFISRFYVYVVNSISWVL